MNTGIGGTPPLILYDHSRKYRLRKFFLYVIVIGGTGEVKVWAAKDFGRGPPVPLPTKMAMALYHAHQAWLKTQRPRSR